LKKTEFHRIFFSRVQGGVRSKEKRWLGRRKRRTTPKGVQGGHILTGTYSKKSQGGFGRREEGMTYERGHLGSLGGGLRTEKGGHDSVKRGGRSKV